jgi:hypothetical protein
MGSYRRVSHADQIILNRHNYEPLSLANKHTEFCRQSKNSMVFRPLTICFQQRSKGPGIRPDR